MDFFDILPEHLIVQTLSNLDNKDLLECCVVSKFWNGFIRNSSLLWKTLCLREGIVSNPDESGIPDWQLLYGKCRIFNRPDGLCLNFSWLEQSWNVVKKFLAMDGSMIAYTGRMGYEDELHLVNFKTFRFSLTPVVVKLCHFAESTLYVVAQDKPKSVFIQKIGESPRRIDVPDSIVQFAVSGDRLALAVTSGKLSVWNTVTAEELVSGFSHPVDDTHCKHLDAAHEAGQELQLFLSGFSSGWTKTRGTCSVLVSAGHAVICVWSLVTRRLQHRFVTCEPGHLAPFGVCVQSDVLSYVDLLDGKTMRLRQVNVSSGRTVTSLTLAEDGDIRLRPARSTSQDRVREIIQLQAAGRRFAVVRVQDQQYVVVDVVRGLFLPLDLPADCVPSRDDPHNLSFGFPTSERPGDSTSWLDGLSWRALQEPMCVRLYHPNMRSMMNDFYLHAGEFVHAGGVEISRWAGSGIKSFCKHVWDFKIVSSPFRELASMANS